MSAPDPQSILATLGLSPDTAPPPADDVWTRLLDIAFDPATPAADSSLVPTMDDDGTLPDDPVGGPDDPPPHPTGDEHGDASGSDAHDHNPFDDAHVHSDEGHPELGEHHDPADHGDHHDPGAWHG